MSKAHENELIKSLEIVNGGVKPTIPNTLTIAVEKGIPEFLDVTCDGAKPEPVKKPSVTVQGCFIKNWVIT